MSPVVARHQRALYSISVQECDARLTAGNGCLIDNLLPGTKRKTPFWEGAPGVCYTKFKAGSFCMSLVFSMSFFQAK